MDREMWIWKWKYARKKKEKLHAKLWKKSYLGSVKLWGNHSKQSNDDKVDDENKDDDDNDQPNDTLIAFWKIKPNILCPSLSLSLFFARGFNKAWWWNATLAKVREHSKHLEDSHQRTTHTSIHNLMIAAALRDILPRMRRKTRGISERCETNATRRWEQQNLFDLHHRIQWNNKCLIRKKWPLCWLEKIEGKESNFRIQAVKQPPTLVVVVLMKCWIEIILWNPSQLQQQQSNRFFLAFEENFLGIK